MKDQKRRNKKMERCCICNKRLESYGNNPEPIMRNGECCDKCNHEYVLTARLNQSLSNSTITYAIVDGSLYFSLNKDVWVDLRYRKVGQEVAEKCRQFILRNE
jgi:hypothetical protein